LSAVLFFGYAGIYGQGTVMLGDVGAIVGWPILLALSLIFSNLWAVKTGEWKGNKNLIPVLVVGVVFLISASLILSYANTQMS
jgi:L-rhamnose-H+ transport protein